MSKYPYHTLTLEEKIGQLIVFGFDALKLNDHAIDMITKYKVGNVILFARNIRTPKQLLKLNQSLQQLSIKTTGIPLLITIDQEGGMVTRIKNQATFFPGAMTISASDHIENSYLVGKLMGSELHHLGVNMNLAPTLDINNNPFNPVIGVRSYSDDPSRVAAYGVEFIKGLQEHVIATAKHFPGHGDTTVDSHLSLPTINKTLDELRELELVPFKEAIDNGLKAIMTTHIDFPKITEGKPATLSKKILTDVLRTELNFKGLIITDCMQMQAIQQTYTTKKGSLLAIEAGANLVCISHSYDLQKESILYIKEQAMKNDDLLDIIDQRVKRVLEYKSNLKDIDFNVDFEDIKDKVINQTNKDFSYSVTKNAFTKVRGENISLSKKTLVIASDPISTTIADEDDGSVSIIERIKKEQLTVDTLNVSIKLEEENINDIINKAKEYEQVIFCTYNANIYTKQLTLLEELNKVTTLYDIMMRNPYDTGFVKDLKHVFAMYEYTPNSVKVFVEYLKGNVVPLGKMVVKL
jgi:beta-N-acetylhexosaminidase